MKFRVVAATLVLACTINIEANQCQSNLGDIEKSILSFGAGSSNLTKWGQLKEQKKCDQGRMEDLNFSIDEN